MSPEWIAAIATIWGGLVSTVAALAAWKAVIATKTAPIEAARTAASLQEASERIRLKYSVFTTVMQNRHFLGEVEAVKALNVIDTVFHDSPPVRDSWARLFAALNDPRNFPPAGPTPLIDERRRDLLASMAADLGLLQNFREDDFTRVYLPRTVLAELQIRQIQQRAALNALSAQPELPTTQSLPTPVVFPPPPSEQYPRDRSAEP